METSSEDVANLHPDPHEDLQDSNLQHKRQRDEALKINLELVKAVEDISLERDILKGKLHDAEISAQKPDGELKTAIKEKFEVLSKVEVYQERISELMEENSRRIRVCLQSLDLVKECVSRIVERMDEVKPGNYVETAELNTEEFDFDKESTDLLMEIRRVHNLAKRAEVRLAEYVEMRRKEKKELENSVVSLTEENRDINSFLRIALVEKEAVERELSRLKGGSEQKKVALLQFAERGLQKVGFGFMIGSSLNDASDNSGSNACGESESGAFKEEEEVVSLALTVEKKIKDMRVEIAQLKKELEESRSDNEQLQSLTEKQAHKIAECTSHINDLKERENRLAQNVEQLVMEITEAQEEVERWREACELEVEAGRHAIEEHEREAISLREELEKTKTSVATLNSKIKLKEQLAVAAIAAQEAAQKSLQVADRRAAELHERIEELTKQLEVADKNIRRKVRHICWPWRVKPELQGLLHLKFDSPLRFSVP